MAVGFEDYDHYDGLGLAELLRSGQVSSTELAEEAIARIDAGNPRINAVVRTMYDLGRTEAATDQAVGPFAGVPFLLKDLSFDYAGVATSRGSRAYVDDVPERDSEMVVRFRRAGVVTLGKTNTPEFGLMGVTEPDLWGPTRNPWNTAHTSGGSSGGSSAAVAAGFVPIASAGDGGGSIRIPSAFTGLFGLKPSRGRTPVGPKEGQNWYGAAQTHVITRSVRDSAAMLDVTQGPDPGRPYGIEPPSRPYLAETSEDPRPLRVALSSASPIGGDVHPDNRRAVEQAASLLEGLGHHVVAQDAPVNGEALAESYITMYFGDVAATLDRIEARLGRSATTDDVELATLSLARIGRTVPAGKFAGALQAWGRFGRQMGEFFEQHDLYLTPTAAQPPALIGELLPSRPEQALMRAVGTLRVWRAVLKTGFIDQLAHESLSRTPFTQLANVTGLPAMSVPLATHTDGLPCGVQFIAPYGREDTLFALAGQLERAAPWFDRRP